MPNLVSPPDTASILAQEFRVGETCSLVLDVPGARTKLRPHPDEGRASVDVSVTDGTADAEMLVDRLGINTRQAANTIRVTARPNRDDPAWWRWRQDSAAKVHVVVHVPARTDLEARVPGGALDLAELRGTLMIQALGAAVQGRNLNGSLALTSRSSEVSIGGFEGTTLDLDAAAGGVSIKNVAADTLSLSGSATTLSVQDSRGSLSVHCTAAPVTITHHSGSCMGRTHGSTLTFVGGADSETDLRTVGAPLIARLPTSNSLDVEAQGEHIALDDTLMFEGRRESAYLVGKLNGGGPSLQLRAVNDSVRCEAQV